MIVPALIRCRYLPPALPRATVGLGADTDGLFAGVVGYDFALVLSGVTSEADLPTDPPAVHTAPDLAVLVDQLLGD